MRGGKRPGAGRRPRFGAHGCTTPMRVPVQLKEEVIAYIEDICRSRHRDAQGDPGDSPRQEGPRQRAISEPELTQVAAILERSLQLKASAGGAIKTEIRRALRILRK